MPPTGRDLYVAPIACAASSTTGTPACEAAATIGSRSALRPNRCTGRIALVRGGTAGAMPAAPILRLQVEQRNLQGHAALLCHEASVFQRLHLRCAFTAARVSRSASRRLI